MITCPLCNNTIDLELKDSVGLPQKGPVHKLCFERLIRGTDASDQADEHKASSEQAQLDIIDFVKDPKTIAKVVEGSMDKRLAVMPDIHQQLENLLTTNIEHDGSYIPVSAIKAKIPDLLALISQTVSSVIGPDYQIPTDGATWDGLRRANEEHEVQRATAKKLLGSDV